MDPAITNRMLPAVTLRNGLCSATRAKALRGTFAGLIAATSLMPAAAFSTAAAMEISGAGATFPFPIFSKWEI
jgi:ABC-type phosphate transport system substrate-binding protein